MAKKRRVLVTGVARWWGALVVQRLVEDPDVAEVIGIDIREPRHDLGRADYLKLDIRHSLIGKLVRAVGIDTVVHTLTRIDSFDMDPARAHEMNVIGTLNLLAGCAGTGSPVRRFVLKSSGHVYGSRFDLPTGLREDHRLDSNSRHQFVRDIVEVESYVSDFAVRNPNITILALRFSNSLNADEPQPLARYLDLEVVPTVIGYDPPIQLIHRDDCIEAMVMATKRGPGGAYNIAPAATSPTATPTSTRRSSRISSTAGRSHQRTETARSKASLPRRRLRLNLAATPVDDKHLTVHVASGIRGQEQDGRGHLVRDSDPTHRVLGQDAVEDRLVGPERFGEAGLDHSGGDRVDPDFPAGLSRQLPGEHDDPCLGDVVDPQADARPQAADAGDVDDRAAVGLHPRFIDQLGQHEDAAEVDLERLVPCRQLGAKDRPHVRVGGRVVDQDVDPGEALHDLLDEALQLLGAAGMGRDRGRLVGVLRVDPLGFDVEVRLLPARQHDLGPVFGEDLRDRAPDAAACSGHERDSPGQIEKGARGHD